MAMHNPPHRGGIVRRQCLEPLGLSVTAAASHLGISRQSLSELVNEHAGVSAEIAIRLTKAFDSTPETWLGLQMPTTSGRPGVEWTTSTSSGPRRHEPGRSCRSRGQRPSDRNRCVHAHRPRRRDRQPGDAVAGRTPKGPTGEAGRGPSARSRSRCHRARAAVEPGRDARRTRRQQRPCHGRPADHGRLRGSRGRAGHHRSGARRDRLRALRHGRQGAGAGRGKGYARGDRPAPTPTRRFATTGPECVGKPASRSATRPPRL